MFGRTGGPLSRLKLERLDPDSTFSIFYHFFYPISSITFIWFRVAIEKIHVKQQSLNKTMLTDLYSLIQDSNFNSTTEEVAQAISALSINGF